MERRPIKGQVEDSISEIKKTVNEGNRVLVTTYEKNRRPHRLSTDHQVKVQYLHSDIDAIERGNSRIYEPVLRRYRGQSSQGRIDLPEVALVLVLDADKEGFRSETSLIQTAGRPPATSMGGSSSTRT